MIESQTEGSSALIDYFTQKSAPFRAYVFFLVFFCHLKSNIQGLAGF